MGLAVREFSNGEVIINEGDTGKSIFRLVEGNADVIADYGKKDPMRLAVLKAGDYFGEMAIFEEYPRSAAVVAASSNVRVLEIPGDELNEFFSENPDVIGELINHLGNKILAMTNDYNEAQALLKNLQEADAGKKKSLFSKIKKHIDLYQSGKNEIAETDDDALRAAYSAVSSEGFGHTETYKKGAVIFYEGDVSCCMYLLRGGTVGIYTGFGEKNEQKAYELAGGSVFGEKGITAEDPMTYTAVAESDDTKAEKIYMEDLKMIFRSCPEEINFILRYLSNRLRHLNNDFLKICKEITEKYNN
ncbi:MAG: cyclic nucleotide-binding domain-containing protein [Lachnospiraceae bacterium]|nr:cyclic nucleotide-binding domain-containing protein [Lachnospiraceae bacterium]